MSASTVARRYGKSLLALSKDRNAVDAVEQDMRALIQAAQENRELSVILASPVVRPEKKEAIVRAVFEGAHELTTGFLALLAKKGRAGLIGDMAEAFVALVREERGVVLAEVVTAVPLDEARRSEINTLIGKVHEGGVELSEKVDPYLIGGFRLRVGDRMIDASVFQSLRTMHRNLTNNPYEPAY
jgi:F-type H+-transporting ATPase subunit delta